MLEYFSGSDVKDHITDYASVYVKSLASKEPSTIRLYTDLRTSMSAHIHLLMPLNTHRNSLVHTHVQASSFAYMHACIHECMHVHVDMSRCIYIT